MSLRGLRMKPTLQFIVLVCFMQGTAGMTTMSTTPRPEPTRNPECPSMHRAAGHIQKAIKTLTQEDGHCVVNIHCSGMNCTGSHQGKDVTVNLEMLHCEKPVKLRIDMVYGKDNVNFHRVMKNGDKQKIGTVKVADLYVKVHLHRDRNIVTAEVDLLTCLRPPLSTCTTTNLLPEQTFCVSMRNCAAGHNVTEEPPLPCGPSTTSSPHHEGHSIPTGFQTSTGRTGRTRSGYFSPTRFHFSAEPSGPASAAPGNHQARKDKKHGMPVGVAVGVGCGGFVALLIIIGVIVYWSKFSRRSRLRAAYYNDISMNDPLYEDFEPEVA